MSNYYQYCIKFVIFNIECNKILLCKRKWENDFNNTYSFAGWKLENSDKDIWIWASREKTEELWNNCRIEVYKELAISQYYIKNNWVHMILSHHFCIFLWGLIRLGEEYESYKWFNLDQIWEDKNIVPTIPFIVKKMQSFIPLLNKFTRIKL